MLKTAAASAAMVCALVAGLSPGAHPAVAQGAPATGLPPGVPEAALRAEPTLPAPAAWPFGEDFPRTSGTGRHAGGAFFWSDFIYDDNGAIGVPPAQNESVGAFGQGTYRYPDDERHARNATDVFRTSIGLAGETTWWRIDWNTLVDPEVPIAAFALDTGGAGGDGVAWPAGAGLSSDGLDHTLVVSGTGAWLHDLGTGTATAVQDLGGSHHVDTEARSFLVSLPRTALQPMGTWTVQLAAGLADETGEAFVELGPQQGALPGQPNVYNVAFRDYDDEPLANNFWMDNGQAEALTAGDVSAFAIDLDWSALADGRTDPEPAPTGYLNRWYVSSRDLGQGIETTQNPTSATYLGRVQPYAVYVPTTYDGSQPAPLSWWLHSLTINHNQYGATAPSLIEQACEDRGAICVTTLGRGPDKYYRHDAEVDFWEVWARVAETYALAADRTTVGGYSMGGSGTYHLTLTYPDAFAAMAIIAMEARDDLPRLENARWLPYFHAHGAFDQLVPLPGALRTIEELDRLGYRYIFDLHPAEDHVTYSLKDGFDQAAAFVAAEHNRVAAPATIVYRWFPDHADVQRGLGPDGAWWLTGLVAVDDAEDARVEARSHALPEPEITVQRSEEVLPGASPSPAVRRSLTWQRGAAPALRNHLDVALERTAAAAIALVESGIASGEAGTATVTSDGDTTLTLTGLAPGTAVARAGETLAEATGDGAAVLALGDGTHELVWAAQAAGPPAAPEEPAPSTSLPATGGGWPALGLTVLLAATMLGAGRRALRSRSAQSSRSEPSTDTNDSISPG